MVVQNTGFWIFFDKRNRMDTADLWVCCLFAARLLVLGQVFMPADFWRKGGMGICVYFSVPMSSGLGVQGQKEYEEPAPLFRENNKGGTRNIRIPQRKP